MRGALVVIIIATTLGCNELFGHHSGVLADAGPCGDAGCEPIILASSLDYSSALTIDDANVYWVDYDTPAIATIRKDGTCADGSQPGDPNCPEQLAPTSTFVTVRSPRSITTDGTNVYWTNYDNTIATQAIVQRSASGAFTLLGLCAVPAIVTVGGDGLVYWTAAGDPAAVFRAQPGVASSASVLVTHAADSGVTDHGNLGIVADKSSVYWVDWRTGGVYSTPLGQPCTQESTCKTLFVDTSCMSTASCTGGTYGPAALVMDDTTLYWTNTFTGTIMRVAKDGTGAATLAIGQGQAQALAIDGGELFWGNFADSTIRTMRVSDPPCDATTCKVLAKDQVFPAGIAADATAIYWTTQRASGTVLTKSGAVTKLQR
jgi:hypothetical protein